MIKAIPTIYNGVEYRSRLEAQVACLLTNLGADFQYEPQGFDLGNGLHYLPDFFVTNNCAFESPSEHRIEKYGCYKGEIGPKQFWIEVKGNFANKESDEEKVLKFANARVEGGFGCDNKKCFPQGTPPNTCCVDLESAICEFKDFDKNCWHCDNFQVSENSRLVENPILVIDELPPITILKNIFVLLDWCRKKRDGLATGAKEISSWSFDYLQEINFGWSGEETLFNDSLAPCLCVDVKGGFHLAPSYFGGLVEIDELRTLDAYKKALEIGKWSPPSHSIPPANYSKSTLELFAKKARERAIGAW